MKKGSLGVALLLVACGSMNNGGIGGEGGGGGNSGAGGGGGGAAPTFAEIYAQIISPSCAPCHTTPTGIGIGQGHLDMTSQSTAYANLVGVAASGAACNGKGTRVVVDMPDSSLLYLKVSPDDPSPCGGKMPLNGAPLNKAQADMIKAWIAAGASSGF